MPVAYFVCLSGHIPRIHEWNMQGTGMGSFFNLDSPLMRFLSRLTDLVILNLLWIICCIPLITAGASTTALYTVTLRMVKGEEGYVFKNFVQAFKDNIRQATIIHVILTVVGVILALDIIIVSRNEFAGRQVIQVIFYMTAVIYLFVLTYVYPILAKFDNPVGRTLVNALLMSLQNSIFTLVMVILNLIPVMLFLFVTDIFFRSLILWLMIGSALTAYLNSFMLMRHFKRYIPEDKETMDKE